jgi:hypothetical protein
MMWSVGSFLWCGCEDMLVTTGEFPWWSLCLMWVYGSFCGSCRHTPVAVGWFSLILWSGFTRVFCLPQGGVRDRNHTEGQNDAETI